MPQGVNLATKRKVPNRRQRAVLEAWRGGGELSKERGGGRV